MTGWEDRFVRLKERLGIEWRDEGLLRQALTHSSYTHENRSDKIYSNERLEFLGDAVLELVISDYLYRQCGDKTEGELTQLRARLVCEPSLVVVARRLGLGDCLLMSRGEERSGGRDRPSILADAFEALLGAIYLDQGLSEARRVVLEEMAPEINAVMRGEFEKDYKTELQERLQRRSPEPVVYRIIKEDGPDHSKVFTAAVYYCGRQLGWGAGHSKKEAEQQAARMALSELNKGDGKGKDDGDGVL